MTHRRKDSAATAPDNRQRSPVAPLVIRRDGIDLFHARDAQHFLARLRGLHDQPPLAPTDALILRPCRAVHTWWLPTTIDVAFVDAAGTVRAIRTLAPGRWALCWSARAVIEMAAGSLARTGLQCGQQLQRSRGGWGR